MRSALRSRLQNWVHSDRRSFLWQRWIWERHKQSFMRPNQRVRRLTLDWHTSKIAGLQIKPRIQSIHRVQRHPCCLPYQYHKRIQSRLAGLCKSLSEEVNSCHIIEELRVTYYYWDCSNSKHPCQFNNENVYDPEIPVGVKSGRITVGIH